MRTVSVRRLHAAWLWLLVPVWLLAQTLGMAHGVVHPAPSGLEGAGGVAVSAPASGLQSAQAGDWFGHDEDESGCRLFDHAVGSGLWPCGVDPAFVPAGASLVGPRVGTVPAQALLGLPLARGPPARA